MAREKAAMTTSADESPTIDHEAARIWELNREGHEAEALAVAEALVAAYPDHPRAQFEYAGALDYQGREAEAVASYRRAQELGLSGDDLPRLYVQLGSTLRNIGQKSEAETFLAEGHARFPYHAGIQAFHALALLSVGRCPEAVITLLDLVTSRADHIALDGYDRALRSYTDDLRDALLPAAPTAP